MNSRSHSSYSRPSAKVDAFVSKLDYPHKRELAAVRTLILAARVEIQEGIKWNSPSFWCGEWFATFHLKAKDGVSVILHRGAKIKAVETAHFVEDPEGILKWITKDRCAVIFKDSADVKRKASAFKSVIRCWAEKIEAEVETT